MVYAVWALRDMFIEEYPQKAQILVKAFADSIKYSKKCLADVSEYSSRKTGLPFKYLKDYFDSLRFDFDEQYRNGLMLYYKKAYEHGYLEEVPRLKFLSLKCPA